MEHSILTVFIIATAFSSCNGIVPDLTGTSFVHNSTSNLGDPLILTSYLENGNIEEAKNASRVHLDAFNDTKSYAGYFTVDDEYNGNLFFWFFPSNDNYAEDPVVLWLQGGPGKSSLFGLFVENGPFVVDDNLTVSRRPSSWTNSHSVLYIDQPAGTGYSFTDAAWLVTDQTQVAEHLYSALTQFFILFPEIQNNSFYIAGESYAGKYIPAIGFMIHQKNQEALVKINLQGLLIGSGLSDPIHQFKYGSLLYQLGLIDLHTSNMYKKEEKNIANYIHDEIYLRATMAWKSLLTYNFILDTALYNVYNYLRDDPADDDTPTNWISFVVQDDVRRALHVGNQTYDSDNGDVYDALYEDISVSVAPWVVELLNHYRILIFNGQLDIVVSYSSTVNYLQHLNFSAAEEYKTATRDAWFVGDRVAGYVKTAGNLTEVMVRNAGHLVLVDQPENAFDPIQKFIRNEPIAKCRK